MLRRKPKQIEEIWRAKEQVLLALAGRLGRSVESLSASVEELAEDNADLERENSYLSVELELREQQIASLLELVAERNRYTEHIAAIDVSRVTGPTPVLEALVSEARELTHEYATAESVIRQERNAQRQFDLELSGL